MSYSWLTFTQAKTALAGRLGDPNKVFWVDLELGEYLKESLRTWNAIAQFHRDRTSFVTQSGFTYYDLTLTANPDAITAGTGSGVSNPPALVGYSLKDRDLINDIQYHLIEAITTVWGGGWTGTDQFTMDDVVRAIERRRNQFLLLTGLHITHSQVSYATPADGRVSLSDSIIDIRRVAWKDGSSFTPLWRQDEYGARGWKPTWNTAAAIVPAAYSAFMTPKVGLQIIPISNLSKTLDLLTINNPTNLDETTGVLLNIPDDFAWVIKWGALADLLSIDTQAYDPARSAYCEQRYQEGLKYAYLYALAQQVNVNGSLVLPHSIQDFDSWRPTWQNLTSAAPTDIAIAGRNLMALNPTPDGVYTIAMDVLVNAPIPSLGSDFIQIGREQIDDILDYAVHLAMFKCQGQEFEGTFPLLDRFTQHAMYHNDRLRAEATNYSIMRELSSKEDLDRPRTQSAQIKELKENAA